MAGSQIWSPDAPATAKQLDYLRSLANKWAVTDEELAQLACIERLDSITKGQASELIGAFLNDDSGVGNRLAVVRGQMPLI